MNCLLHWYLSWMVIALMHKKVVSTQSAFFKLQHAALISGACYACDYLAWQALFSDSSSALHSMTLDIHLVHANTSSCCRLCCKAVQRCSLQGIWLFFAGVPAWRIARRGKRKKFTRPNTSCKLRRSWPEAEHDGEVAGEQAA